MLSKTFIFHKQKSSHNLFLYFLLLMMLIMTAPVWAENICNHCQCQFPFYVGFSTGYGTTTWEGLVPPENMQNIATSLSTPSYVSEGGAVWGFFAGYELLPSFAIEASYLRYPDAKISFDETSLFTFEHDGRTSFTSRTETVAVMGKIMMFIPCTFIRAYSSLGASEIHRSDELNNHWILRPTFGAGFSYNITDHIMAELEGNYTAGDGKSELNPTADYFPFLYSILIKLAYRF